MTTSTPGNGTRAARGKGGAKPAGPTAASPAPEGVRKAADSLRKRAEASIRAGQVDRASDSAQVDAQRTLHELQVHQVELELQNEELRRANDELSAMHARYHDLYDFAPVAYFTIDSERRIVEANLAGARLLGLDRGRLPKRRLAEFLHANSLVAFEQLAGRALIHDTLLEEALVIQPQAAEAVHVKVQARRVDEPTGGHVRLVMMDVSALRLANEELARSLENFFRYWRP